MRGVVELASQIVCVVRGCPDLSRENVALRVAQFPGRGKPAYPAGTAKPNRTGLTAFPKVRLVILIEAGTHLIFDALMCLAGDAPPPVHIAWENEYEH